MAFLKPICAQPSVAPAPSGRAGFLFVLVMLVTGALAFSGWGAESASETQVKAALIYRFATLTEWPASAFASSDAPLCIVIVGQGPLETSFRAVAEGKKIGTHPVQIVPETELARHPVIHVLVFAESHKGQLPEQLAKTSGKPVLTIGEQSEFTKVGGMIRLRREGPKLTFDVNVRALRLAEPAGLKLNPQVLKLGHIVEGGDAP